ncbi:hypothetical protein SAMN05216361_3618 [Marisediminitalea aggregata]|uniref:Uncharacterized protein n=1 Tax=Marisediminitalea aggregata TaxID=634436 RepID=A0A1M5PWZ3_9ALTE|nr:hypothetical protein SAMN05216361_3618 [Marisediminitalea aggregata]
MKTIFVLAISPLLYVQLTKIFFRWSGHADLVANLLFLAVILITLLFIGTKTVKR